MERKSWFAAAVGSILFVPTLFALLKLALHFTANAFPPYEFFRDELYYIVSTDHLAAGYVDHPPLSIWILALSRMLFGDSLFAIRLLPAFAGAGMVFLTGLMVRELGGGRSAQVLACAATFLSLASIAGSTFYSMNAWDMVFWSIALLIVLKIARQPSMRLWLNLGVVLGLGLLNKTGVLWLGAGIGVGLLLTPLRTELRGRGPWFAAGFAFFLFLPYIIWNAANDWAHLEFIRNASTFKYAGLNPLDVLLGQVPVNNPVTLPLWLAGIAFYFLPVNRTWRIAGITYLTVLAILILNGTSKPEYLAPAVPMLFAGGAILIDRLRVRWLRIALRSTLALLFVAGLGFIPLVLPILTVSQFTQYAKAIGFESKSAESKELGDLPQFYADMHGWKDLAASVDTVYRSLSDNERQQCVIYAQNYGQASAITFLGGPLGLPPAVSGHNSYYLWGPGAIREPEAVIIVGGKKEDYERGFEEVQLVMRYTSPHIMPYEDQKPIYVCRKPKAALKDLWASVKDYE
jgi:hypothetical protein